MSLKSTYDFLLDDIVQHNHSDVLKNNESQTISGDFTVEGTLRSSSTLTLSAENFLVSANFIDLNTNLTGDAGELNPLDAGIRVHRSISGQAELRWDESEETWKIGAVTGSLSAIATDNQIQVLDNRIDILSALPPGLFNWTEDISGNLFPNSGNIQSIGSVTNKVKDIYLTSGSVYLDDKNISRDISDNLLWDGNILGLNSDIIDISADVKINTSNISDLSADTPDNLDERIIRNEDRASELTSGDDGLYLKAYYLQDFQSYDLLVMDFEDGNIEDETGNNTPTGGSTTSFEKYFGGYSLDAGAGTMDTGLAYDFTTAFDQDKTISFFIKFPTVPSSIVRIMDINNPYTRLDISESTTGDIHLYQKNSSDNYCIVGTDGTVLSDSIWHHVVIVCLGQGTTNNLAIYVDGQQEGFNEAENDLQDFTGNWRFLDNDTYYVDDIRFAHSNIYNANPNASNTDSFTVPTSQYNGELIKDFRLADELPVHFGTTDVSTASFVLDEDDMATDSDTQLATQQSIKSYISATSANLDPYALSSDLQSVSSDVITNTNNITTISGDLDTAEENIISISADTITNTNNITTISGDLDTAEENISDILNNTPENLSERIIRYDDRASTLLDNDNTKIIEAFYNENYSEIPTNATHWYPLGATETADDYIGDINGTLMNGATVTDLGLIPGSGYININNVGNLKSISMWVWIDNGTQDILKNNLSSGISCSANILNYPDWDNIYVNGINTNVIETAGTLTNYGFTGGSMLYDVYSDDNFVYIGSSNNIKVYTVDSAGNFTHKSTLNQRGYSITGDGNFIYVISYYNSERKIVSFSVDEYGNLIYIDSKIINESNHDCDIIVYNNFIYVSEDSKYLKSFSVDEYGMLTLEKTSANAASVHNRIWIDSNFLYAGSDDYLQVYSLDETGGFTLEQNISFNNYDIKGIWGDDNFIYLATKNAGLRSYTVTETGLFNLVDTVTSSIGVYSVWGDGDLLYVGDAYSSPENCYIRVYLVSKTGHFIHLDSKTINNDDRIHNIYGDDNFIYVPFYENGTFSYKASTYQHIVATSTSNVNCNNIKLGKLTNSLSGKIEDVQLYSNELNNSEIIDIFNDDIKEESPGISQDYRKSLSKTSDIITNTNNITTISADTITNTNNISTISGDLNTAEGNITTISADTITNTNNISTISGDVLKLDENHIEYSSTNYTAFSNTISGHLSGINEEFGNINLNIINLDSVTATTTADTFSNTIANGSEWKYVIKGVNSTSGNIAAGNILATWNESTTGITYNEIETGDLGNVSADFDIENTSTNINLLLNINNGEWDINIKRELI